MLKRFSGLWRRSRRRKREVPLAERFAHFRAAGAANDSFLRNLALLQQKLEDGIVPGMGTVSTVYESLTAPVAAMVRSLVAMSGGRYESLLGRYEAIDRDLATEVLKARPIEFGPMIAWPEDSDAVHPQVVGPKAARLAEVVRTGGFVVPPFFAVTVYAYQQFMGATGVQDLVNELLLSADLREAEPLKRFSEVATSAIETAPVPPQLAIELDQAYRRLRSCSETAFGVAVRSSAVVEDSESSFAGQFETVLNVNEAGLLQAYKRVIASKYRLEAVKYALARGFLDQDVTMPVLVMAMVQPSVSGVAYSRAPERSRCALVTAVSGLAQPVVDGRVIPDTYMVGEGTPPRIEDVSVGIRGMILRCAGDGGLDEVAEDTVAAQQPSISPDQAIRVAQASWRLERRFGDPQDVEWAMDDADRLFIVQTRPLHASSLVRTEAGGTEVLASSPVLIRDARRASPGAASGTVRQLADVNTPEAVPEGTVLVVPTTSPRLAGLIQRLAAVVSVAGSTTGHMATVAREFGVPCLVGAETAMDVLQDGMIVTVDAWTGVVYLGEVPEITTGGEKRGPEEALRDPVRESFQKLVDMVAPLTLTDPESLDFRPRNCKTLHDVARFVHQRTMAEMFQVPPLTARERYRCRRLDWRVPIEVCLLDLGGGTVDPMVRKVPVDGVVSVPLAALIEGMTDERLRWSGPVGFDLKGFMSVAVRSAVDDQRYGEPSFALCSHDFVHFSSRLAYHFATVESICGEIVNENYARFLFHGGAAVAERREYRVHFLAVVLERKGFAVKRTGDRIEATLPKRDAEVLKVALVTLGRLMVAARHLDMLMESRSAAEAYAQAFLAGDYGFRFLRRRL